MGNTADGHVIDLHDVSKLYRGGVCALRGIEMRVRRGEVFGLLGPNGAGKSTLVKIMMTVVRATRAEGTLLGEPLGDKATLARVGYLPENHRFPRYLTGRQVIEFFGALAKVDRRARRRRAAELIETVGMSHAADRRVATYSKGMAQRIGLAQALINDPALVLLDEPTDGVDPGGRRDIRQVMGRLREQGKTVFVNSHLLSELEMTCDRVAILVGGTVARQGTIDELTLAKQSYEIELLPDGQVSLAELVERALPGVFPAPAAADAARPGPVETPSSSSSSANELRGRLAGGQWVELRGAVLSVGTTNPADVQPLLDALRARQITIRRVEPVRPSLEDLFMEAVDQPEAGAADEAGKSGARGAA
jgi:ABC-2 type transport system ATP-binding protein